MKKLVIIMLLTLGLVGCSDYEYNETPPNDIRHFFDVVCDHETGVEYFMKMRTQYIVAPRYNLDGTLKKCD